MTKLEEAAAAYREAARLVLLAEGKRVSLARQIKELEAALEIACREECEVDRELTHVEVLLRRAAAEAP